jgi:hypothetical protein
VYDQGASQLQAFAKGELQQYLTEDLDPLGREIIACAVDGGSVDDFDRLISPV